MNHFQRGLFYIRHFLEMMLEDGYTVVSFEDEEEETKVGNIDEAVEAIAAVELGTFYFEDENGGTGYWCFFVPENADDALVDWNIKDGPWDEVPGGNWEFVVDENFLWKKLGELMKDVDHLNQLADHYRTQLAQVTRPSQRVQ